MPQIRKNGDLRGTPHVRVIGANGEMLGVMVLAEALRLALQEGLDLVEVNPRAEPPVCKLLEFGEYTYEEQRARPSASVVLEIAGSHDVIVMLDPDARPNEPFRNVVRRTPSGAVVWEAELPGTGCDVYVSVAWVAKQLIANTWSCYSVWLDVENGRIVNAVFTK